MDLSRRKPRPERCPALVVLVLVLVLVLVAAVGACARSERPVERWREIDGGPVAEFWRCLFTTDVDVGSLRNGQQVRRLVEAAYAGGEEAFVDSIRTVCVPALGRARRALATPGPPPQADPSALGAYAATLERLEATASRYAARMRLWDPLEEETEIIPARAAVWQASTRPSPEAASYDLFLRCVVPEVETLKDGQAIYEHLTNRCFRGDPVAFTDDVRVRCGPLLRTTTARPARSFQATRQRLRDEQPRQAQVWSRCLELAQEQRRLNDGAELVAATDLYLAARATAGVVR